MKRADWKLEIGNWKFQSERRGQGKNCNLQSASRRSAEFGFSSFTIYNFQFPILNSRPVLAFEISNFQFPIYNSKFP